MNLKDMKIGMRLGMGFGIVMLLLVTLIVVAQIRLANISDINDRIIGVEWVQANAAQTINAMACANARRTMELFITSDANKVTRIYQQIDANKKTIDEGLETLDKLMYKPDGKALLPKIRASRATYVASFSEVAQLLTEQKRDEAAIMTSADD
jgi:methyl-accepting chemotaxis protein